MKKVLIILIAAVMMLTFVSCLREADDNTTPDTDPVNETVPTTVPEKTPDEKDVPPEPEDPPKPEEPEEKVPTVGTPDESGIVAVVKIELDRYETTITVGQTDMPWETLFPLNSTDKRTTWSSSDTRVATVDEYGRVTGVGEGECIITDTSASSPEVTAEFKVTVKPKPAIETPTYIDGILIANKTYPLPDDYNPGIDDEAYSALNEMISAAAKDGITLTMVSGFRSYETQQGLYARYLLREGRDAADRYSARPGYSEHQTGLAFDLNSLEYSFADTAEGKWLAANCAEYGFIIRYPDGKEDVTGYHYEPWHVRYLGKETAKKVFDSGLCLEEYLGITSVYEY